MMDYENKQIIKEVLKRHIQAETPLNTQQTFLRNAKIIDFT